MSEHAEMVKKLSIAEALELRSLLDRHLAQLALKTLSASHLEAIDESKDMANATSLAEKAAML